jgi:hypothetical protein
MRNWKHAELSAMAKADQITAEVFKQKLTENRDLYIGGMAVAFMDATGLTIDQVKLVVKQRPPFVTEYWFEKKEGPATPSLPG